MIYGTDFAGFATGFVHKRLLRAAGGFVSGGFAGAAAGFLAPTPSRAPAPSRLPPPTTVPRHPPPRTLTARPSAISAAEKEAGRATKFAGELIVARKGVTLATDCPPGMIPSVHGGCSGVSPASRCRIGFVRNASGVCVRRGANIFDPLGLFGGPPKGAAPVATTTTFAAAAEPTLAGQVVGPAVMGRYGAAYNPGSQIINRAVCLPGDIVANDGLCYPKGSITNRERAWPKGRRPLLTGGEMRAISIAARAGKRVEQASKRLQSIGLMKKPASRRAAAHPRHPQLGPGS